MTPDIALMQFHASANTYCLLSSLTSGKDQTDLRTHNSGSSLAKWVLVEKGLQGCKGRSYGHPQMVFIYPAECIALENRAVVNCIPRTLNLIQKNPAAICNDCHARRSPPYVQIGALHLLVCAACYLDLNVHLSILYWLWLVIVQCTSPALVMHAPCILIDACNL